MKRNYLYFLSIIIIFNSCEPADEIPTPTNESHSCLLKQFIEVSDSDRFITEFHYQNDTQLTLVTEYYSVDSFQTPDTVNMVQWEDGLIKYFYENGIEVYFEWNGDKLAKTSGYWFGEFYFTFDAQGKLERIDCEYPSWLTNTYPASYHYFWENGNIIKVEAKNEANQLIHVDEIVFDNKNNFFKAYSWMKVGLNPGDAPYTLSKNNAIKLTRNTYENGSVSHVELLNEFNYLYNEFEYPKSIVFDVGELQFKYINCR